MYMNYKICQSIVVVYLSSNVADVDFAISENVAKNSDSFSFAMAD